MKPDKAIELNKETEDSLRKHKFIDHADAVKLGSEALKRVLDSQEKGRNLDYQLLPGEDACIKLCLVEERLNYE